MNCRTALGIIFGVVFGFVTILPSARLDEADQAPRITLSQPIQTRRQVLPTATYWLVLVSQLAIAVFLLITVPFWGLGGVLWRSRRDSKQIMRRPGPLISRRPLVRMKVTHGNDALTGIL
jgi:hypothetical protein